MSVRDARVYTCTVYIKTRDLPSCQPRSPSHHTTHVCKDKLIKQIMNYEEAMWARGLHYSVDLWLQTYAEPVQLKCRKLATEYPWIYGYFYSVAYIQQSRSGVTGSRVRFAVYL